MNKNALLQQTATGMELIMPDDRSRPVPEKDLWLVKRLLDCDVSADDLLTLITKSTKEEYPLVNFTLVQFIVDYDGYLDTKDQSINKIAGKQDERNNLHLKAGSSRQGGNQHKKCQKGRKL